MFDKEKFLTLVEKSPMEAARMLPPSAPSARSLLKEAGIRIRGLVATVLRVATDKKARRCATLSEALLALPKRKRRPASLATTIERLIKRYGFTRVRAALEEVARRTAAKKAA